MTKVVLTTGGTGGHFFAAIAVHQELLKQNISNLIIADERCMKYNNGEYQVEYLNFNYQSGGLINKIKLFTRICYLTIPAYKLLKKLQPKVVIGFGGYVSMPTVVAAYLLKIPIIIHEQNSYLGKANLALSYVADKITVSYKEFLERYPNNKKFVYIGQIVRDSIRKIDLKNRFNNNECVLSDETGYNTLVNNLHFKNYDSADLKHKEQKLDSTDVRRTRSDDVENGTSIDCNFNIFVFGGSQGAKSFTDTIPESIKLVKQQKPELQLHITQQANKKDLLRLQNNYNNLKIDYTLAEFFFDMNKEYETADLVISRSGASTIAEFCKVGIPSILIPYPYAAHNHQLYNARLLEKYNAAICIEPKVLTAEILAQKILYLIDNRNVLKTIASNIQKIPTNGAEQIINTLVKKFT